MFLLKQGQANLTSGQGQYDHYDQILQSNRYRINIEQLIKEQEGVLRTLEIYHSFISYFFYAIVLLAFSFLFFSFLSVPLKKLSKFIWKTIMSDMFLFIVGAFVIVIGFIIMGITMYEIVYETYLWHNNKLKYFENLTERELAYTHERNYL